MNTIADVPEQAPATAVAERTFSLKRILVATDGGESGHRAVAFAVTLAERHGSELELCYVIDRTAAISECCSVDGGTDMILPLIEAFDDMAKVALAKASEFVKKAGVVATTSTLEGIPPQTIVERATDQACDAIVVGTRGTRGVERLVLGSTADGVLRRAEVPVFVIPPGPAAAVSTFDRLFVAIDDSDPGDAAAAFAIAFAEANGAKLVLCGVAETKYLVSRSAMFAFDATPILRELREHVLERLQTIASNAAERGVACETLVVDGDPVATILAIATSEKTGMIVLGTHGRRGLQRLFLGSVAESVVQTSHVPVVVVRTLSGASRHRS